MRFLALLLSFMLFSATVVESFHHHDDADDHADCPICVAALHHSANTALPSPILLSLPEVSPTVFPQFILETVTISACYAPGDRAPPC